MLSFLGKLDGFQELIEKITPKDTSFLKEIILPKTGEIYTYNQSFFDWLFLSDRFSNLKLKTKGVSI